MPKLFFKTILKFFNTNSSYFPAKVATLKPKLPSPLRGNPRSYLSLAALLKWRNMGKTRDNTLTTLCVRRQGSWQSTRKRTRPPGSQTTQNAGYLVVCLSQAISASGIKYSKYCKRWMQRELQTANCKMRTAIQTELNWTELKFYWKIQHSMCIISTSICANAKWHMLSCSIEPPAFPLWIHLSPLSSVLVCRPVNYLCMCCVLFARQI